MSRGIPKYIHGHTTKMSNNHFWNGGICTSTKGYILIRDRASPMSNKRGYYYLHRKIMSDFLGRTLSKEELVHHINGIRTDNRIENLVIMTRSDHSALHNKNRKEVK